MSICKKNSKSVRFLVAVITLAAMLSCILAVPASAYYNVTIYAPDGRTAVVPSYEVYAYTNVGWYEYPVTTMYAPDGRSIVVATSDVAAWESVGWYDGNKKIKIYSRSGNIASIPAAQKQAYLNVGWFDYPVPQYATGVQSYNTPVFLPRYDTVVYGTLYNHEQSGNAHTYIYSSYEDAFATYIYYLQSQGWYQSESNTDDTIVNYTYSKGNSKFSLGYNYANGLAYVSYTIYTYYY